MAFPSRHAYEHLIYTLLPKHPEIASFSLRLYSTSRGTAIVKGIIHFHNGLELRVHEIVDFVTSRISEHSYAVFRGKECIRWYDPQPHPENPDLAATFPHHCHNPPDIKHNRKPAPGIRFTEVNLPTLIADCVALGSRPPTHGGPCKPQ